MLVNSLWMKIIENSKKQKQNKGENMILVKVYQNGRESYQKIELKDAVKFNKSALVFTTEDDEDAYDDYLDDHVLAFIVVL